MSWDDHEGPRTPPKFHTGGVVVQHSTQRDTLRALAGEYQKAAGFAYARGQDDVAAKMRDASKELLALADRLPSIPIETLTRGS
jgi:hypothetical protein